MRRVKSGMPLAMPLLRVSRPTWPLLLALISSFATYTSDEGKLPLYLLAVASFVVCVLASGASFRSRPNILLAGIAFLIVSMLSVLVNINDFREFPLQTIAYPVVFLLIAGSVWKIVFRPKGKVAIAIFALFAVNGAIALFSSAFHADHLPVVGDISLGRSVFLTNFPSSGGLIWNVNYYAAVQGAGFWFLFSLIQRGNLSGRLRWGVYLIGLSMLLGSSRSCTAAMIVSIAVYAFFRGSWGLRTLIAGAAVAFVLSVSSLYLWALSHPEISSGLRIYKGLNARDDLWIVAIELIKAAPLFGYGSPKELASAMVLGGAGGTTTQNSLLSTQLLFGLGGTLIFVYLLASAARRFILDPDRSSSDTALMCLIVFCTIDSFVRSYMIGGVGLIPLLYASALVYFVSPKRLRV